MKTVLEKHIVARDIGNVEVPWEVWRLFGPQQKAVSILGPDISLGEDFGSVDQCRDAIAWYVEQLGGKVKWSKE